VQDDSRRDSATPPTRLHGRTSQLYSCCFCDCSRGPESPPLAEQAEEQGFSTPLKRPRAYHLIAPHALTMPAMPAMSLFTRLSLDEPSAPGILLILESRSLVGLPPPGRPTTQRRGLFLPSTLNCAPLLKHVGSFFASHLLNPTSLIRRSHVGRYPRHGSPQLYPQRLLFSKDGHTAWHL
jgi:hypothetical protein